MFTQTNQQRINNKRVFKAIIKINLIENTNVIDNSHSCGALSVKNPDFFSLTSEGFPSLTTNMDNNLLNVVKT